MASPLIAQVSSGTESSDLVTPMRFVDFVCQITEHRIACDNARLMTIHEPNGSKNLFAISSPNVDSRHMERTDEFIANFE
jgi:predicted site-specific integrase-resolvase